MVGLAGRGWVLAPSLEAAWREANRRAPRRSKLSDGSIGDAAHASRASFHNPAGGFVHALDLTHDPAGGFDAHGLAKTIAARRDPRVRKLISQGRVWEASTGRWRRYHGSNPHNTHLHIEVHQTGRARNDLSPWFDAAVTFPTPEPKPKPKPSPPPEVKPLPLEDEMHHWYAVAERGYWMGAGLLRVRIDEGRFRLAQQAAKAGKLKPGESVTVLQKGQFEQMTYRHPVDVTSEATWT